MSKDSQTKYRQEHPTLSLVCRTKEEYARIVEQAKQQGLSVSDYLKKVVFENINSFDKGYDKGYEDNYEEIFQEGETKGIEKGKKIGFDEAEKRYRQLIDDAYVHGKKDMEVVLADEINVLKRKIKRRDRREMALSQSWEELDAEKKSNTEYLGKRRQEMRHWKKQLDEREKQQDEMQGLMDSQARYLKSRGKTLNDFWYAVEKQIYKLQIEKDMLSRKWEEIDFTKKDLLKLSRQIGMDLAEISRNKHFLFLTEESKTFGKVML